MDILGIIPARGGSKAIPRKNLVELCGKPLLAYAAEAARNSRLLTRTIVSTDDAEIASSGRDLGLDVPFTRPANAATDESPMIDVLTHALGWLQRDESYQPEVIVLLQPTSPLRRSEHIDAAVELLLEAKADTVVSVVQVPHQFSPDSLFELENGALRARTDNPVLLRQAKPRLFARNGPAVLVMRRSVVETKRLYGDLTLPYIMSILDSVDIDSHEDLVLAECLLKHRPTR